MSRLTHACVVGCTYDPAGNRLVETTATTTTAGQFNSVNQLKGLTSAASNQTIAGHTSAAVTLVNVDAVPATLSNSTNFTANVSMPSGTNTVSVVAQPTGTSTATTTQRYQVVASGSAPTALTYDLNGNVLTDEKGNTYMWDALNRLAAIAYHSGTYSGTHTEFAYDGLSRRTQIVERAGTTMGTGTITSTKNYLWIGSEIAEERSSSTTVTKRFFPQGEQQSGTNYYYTRDHLGSVREMCSSSGAIISRMAYDPYGKTTTVSGTILPTKQYAGYYAHQTSGLYLTKYRALDPNTGRWFGRDPIGEKGGINLYGYVADSPINSIDMFGTCDCCWAEALAVYGWASVLSTDVRAAADQEDSTYFSTPGIGDEHESGSSVAGMEAVKTGVAIAGAEGADFGIAAIELLREVPGVLNTLGILEDGSNLSKAVKAYQKCREASKSKPGCSFDKADKTIADAIALVQQAGAIANSQPDTTKRYKAEHPGLDHVFPYY